VLNLDKKKKQHGIKIGVLTREMIDWQVFVPLDPTPFSTSPPFPSPSLSSLSSMREEKMFTSRLIRPDICVSWAVVAREAVGSYWCAGRGLAPRVSRRIVLYGCVGGGGWVVSDRERERARGRERGRERERERGREREREKERETDRQRKIAREISRERYRLREQERERERPKMF